MKTLFQTVKIKDEPVFTEWLQKAGITLYVRRYDQMHPFIAGNKPFKLSGWLAERKKEQLVISFGGAWSNHLLALAAAGYELGIKTTGIVRGERVIPLNPMLQQMETLGMILHFVSRSAYRAKEVDPAIQALIQQMGDVLVVPEGGGGLPGVKGAADMVNASEPYDWVILPGGTGTTAAGVASKLSHSKTKVLVFQVLKGKSILKNEVYRESGLDLDHFENLEIREDFHFGGYAKENETLRHFAIKWESETGMFLDRVYGLKAMAGIKEIAGSGFFKPNSRLLYLHTGGFSGFIP